MEIKKELDKWNLHFHLLCLSKKPEGEYDLKRKLLLDWYNIAGADQVYIEELYWKGIEGNRLDFSKVLDYIGKTDLLAAPMERMEVMNAFYGISTLRHYGIFRKSLKKISQLRKQDNKPDKIPSINDINIGRLFFDFFISTLLKKSYLKIFLDCFTSKIINFYIKYFWLLPYISYQFYLLYYSLLDP